MRTYGTLSVFREKTAGLPPLAARVALAEMMGGNEMADQRGEQEKAQLLNAMIAQLELERMRATSEDARHTRAPLLLNAEEGQIPPGMSEGMVRLASAAGVNLARIKTGAAEPAPGPDLVEGAKKVWDRTGLSGGRWKWKLPALAAGGTAIAGGVHVLKKGLNWLGQEPRVPSYNAGGNQLAHNVNEYGASPLNLPTGY